MGGFAVRDEDLDGWVRVVCGRPAKQGGRVGGVVMEDTLHAQGLKQMLREREHRERTPYGSIAVGVAWLSPCGSSPPARHCGAQKARAAEISQGFRVRVRVTALSLGCRPNPQGYNPNPGA